RHCRALYVALCSFTATATTEIYTLSLHDALPIFTPDPNWPGLFADPNRQRFDVDKMLEVADWIDSQIKSIQSANYTPQSLATTRSEEHTSELQSLAYLVCRLLLEKKKTTVIRVTP